MSVARGERSELKMYKIQKRRRARPGADKRIQATMTRGQSRTKRDTVAAGGERTEPLWWNHNFSKRVSRCNSEFANLRFEEQLRLHLVFEMHAASVSRGAFPLLLLSGGTFPLPLLSVTVCHLEFLKQARCPTWHNAQPGKPPRLRRRFDRRCAMGLAVVNAVYPLSTV